MFALVGHRSFVTLKFQLAYSVTYIHVSAFVKKNSTNCAFYMFVRVLWPCPHGQGYF